VLSVAEFRDTPFPSVRLSPDPDRDIVEARHYD
jgi:hypothetical protein